MSLSEKVAQLLVQVDVTPDGAQALKHASDLADQFGYVMPQESTIPLDALAGFPQAQVGNVQDIFCRSPVAATD